MKTCEYSGCTNQINVWLKFCPQHQQMMMQQTQQQQRVIEMPPSIPTQKVSMPTATETLPTFVRPIQETKTFQQKDKENNRRDAMRFAVDLITQTDIEQKPYDQMINEIRTLTNELQRILEE
jgi:hypothetical protein